MKSAARFLAVLAAMSAPVHAEVSADRHPDGSTTSYFVAAERGPWERLRPAVASADILNEQGDSAGDAWPIVFDNAPLARPEAVWSSSGQDSDVFSSRHDGSRWTERMRLSEESGADTVPALAVDQYGNRFVAWDRQRNGRHSVEFTALASDDSGQTPVKELSSRPRQGHSPSLATSEDGLTWVGYEEAVSANDSTVAVGIDRVTVPRNDDGSVRCSGEVPIDVARSRTFVTHRAAGDGSADARMNGESGEVWVTWIDSDHQVGYSQLIDGEFGSAQYRDYTDAGEIASVRAQIRQDILSP